MTSPLLFPAPGPCAWVVGGVHGNEPAGVAAILEHGPFPDWCLVIPCAHPLALVWGDRYGDIDSYKSSLAGMLRVAEVFPPKLVLNLHEDDEVFFDGGAYLYHYGTNGRLPQFVLARLREGGLPIMEKDPEVWEIERVENGIVKVADDDDPSIDRIFLDRYGTETLVIETPSKAWPVKARIRAHSIALDALPALWAIVNAH